MSCLVRGIHRCSPPAIRFAGVLLVMLLILSGPAGAQDDTEAADAHVPVASAARLGGDIERTRFVLDLTSAVGFSVYVLADPFRIIIDLPEVNFQLPPGLGTQGHGLVTAYRYGLFEAGKSRVVLDSSEPVLIENSFVLRPQNGQPARLVVDLVRTDRETYFRIHDLVDRTQEESEPDTQAEQQPAGGEPAEEPGPDSGEPVQVTDAPVPLENPMRTGEVDHATIEAQRAALREEAEGPVRHVVVIDPGHGGVDPGAIGRRGTTEKRVVFELSLVLRDLLVAEGKYDVFMTREEDTFVSLRDRVEFARHHQADLFIAVHADSLRRRTVRGGTVYTLSERASDREAEELARRENRADLISGVNLVSESDEVTGILLDLAQRETNNLSVRFARAVVASLDGVTRLTRNPHRLAGFRVLKAPDIPSVLLEIGYISNSADEDLLRSDAWRAKTAKALVEAIGAYFDAHR